MRQTDAERLDETARMMISADRADQPLEPILRKKCSFVYKQLQADREHPELLKLWGDSLNFDENAKAIIVHPAILRTIGDVAGAELVSRVVHAGLTHTYGYLFSIIETPYGLKRERWLNAKLERGLGITSPSLRARPRQGTLLTNLTWFLCQIALDQDAHTQTLLQTITATVAPDVRDYPFGSLTGQRITEQFVAPDERNRCRNVTILTDLIQLPYPPRNARAPQYLLVYSVADRGELGPQLITAFTVTKDVVAALTAPESLGSTVPIRTRYNCYLAGLTGHEGTGTRTVTPWSHG